MKLHKQVVLYALLRAYCKFSGNRAESCTSKNTNCILVLLIRGGVFFPLFHINGIELSCKILASWKPFVSDFRMAEVYY